MEFIRRAQGLGKPPVIWHMNLNQQSRGKDWSTHKSLMNSISPIVDCGVHYVDVMCQMTRAKPVRVSAIGARRESLGCARGRRRERCCDPMSRSGVISVGWS